MKSLSVTTTVLLFGIALEVSAASEYRILSACDASAEVRANVSKDAQVEVRYSIASSSTCYSVTATVDGKQVQGYVLDASLDAVAAFERERIKTSRDTLNAPPVIPQPVAQPAAPVKSEAEKSDKEEPKEQPKEEPKPPPIKKADLPI